MLASVAIWECAYERVWIYAGVLATRLHSQSSCLHMSRENYAAPNACHKFRVRLPQLRTLSLWYLDVICGGTLQGQKIPRWMFSTFLLVCVCVCSYSCRGRWANAWVYCSRRVTSKWKVWPKTPLIFLFRILAPGIALKGVLPHNGCFSSWLTSLTSIFFPYRLFKLISVSAVWCTAKPDSLFL